MAPNRHPVSLKAASGFHQRDQKDALITSAVIMDQNNTILWIKKLRGATGRIGKRGSKERLLALAANEGTPQGGIISATLIANIAARGTVSKGFGICQTTHPVMKITGRRPKVS